MVEPEEHLDASLVTENHAPVDRDEIAHLKELTAQATAKYAMKDYNTAAELYAFATELQAKLNGEMDSANADLLYAYGRCLYHVAVRKSDVLGLSKVSGNDPEIPNGVEKKAGQPRKQTKQMEDPAAKAAENTVEPTPEERKTSTDQGGHTEGSNKPYFQFTGDENFEDSDGDESRNSNEDGDEEVVDEDDFSIAYEVLDMARLLLQKRKDEIEESSTGKDQGEPEIKETRQIVERLADTYDLQAEISLEGEKFPAAVTDLRSALDLKTAIYPCESSVIAEGHYKLSLALEFASVTQQKDEQGETTGDSHIDEKMREEAAHELEAAIHSCKLRIQKEEAKLSSESGVRETDIKDKTAQIEDVKDMVRELSQRLVEIRQAPMSIDDSTTAQNIDGNNPVAGLLGSILGDSLATRKAKIEEASRNAHDLTGLVKKKKLDPNDMSSQPKLGSTNNTKRKLETHDQNEVGTEKKARIDDAEGG